MTCCFSFLSLLERPVAECPVAERPLAALSESPSKEQAHDTARLTLSSFDDVEARLPTPMSTFDSPVKVWSLQAGKPDSPLYDLPDPEAPTECSSDAGTPHSQGSSRYWHSRSVTIEDTEAAEDEEPDSPASLASPQSPQSPPAWSPSVGVQHTFRSFCQEFCDPERIGAGMCGRTFAWVCSTAGLPVSEREAASLFANLADEEGPGGKGDQRMGLAQFEEALRALAQQHGLEEDDARRMVVAAARPLLKKMASKVASMPPRNAKASTPSRPLQSPHSSALRKQRSVSATLPANRMAALQRASRNVSFGSVQTALALGA